MRKKQSGFSLIELLVTITLMLSILGIAIVSFTKISENRKNQSWELVKEQIETAAKEYFNVNEYWFEGLYEGATGKIYVSKLVEGDYLSKVVNPTNGENISKCAYVNVKKTKIGYSSSFDDGSEKSSSNCDDAGSVVVVSEKTVDIPNPTAKITFKKINNDESYEDVSPTENGWYNKAILGDNKPLVFEISVDENKSGEIKSVKLEMDDGKIITLNSDSSYSNENIKKYYYHQEEDANGKVVNIVVENKYGKIYKTEKTINKDTTPPAFDYDLSYKVFNISQRNTMYDINAISNKTGVTIEKADFLGFTINSKTSILWTNPQGIDNIYKLELVYNPNVDLKNVIAIDVEPYKLGEILPTNNFSIKHLKTSSESARYVIEFFSPYNLREVLLKFQCSLGEDCIENVSDLNNTGYSIYTHNKEMRNNYNNFIRIEVPKCSDATSGCKETGKYCKDNNSWSDFKFVQMSFKPGNDESKNGVLAYRGEGIHHFMVYDNAGNSTDTIINTNGKFK